MVSNAELDRLIAEARDKLAYSSRAVRSSTALFSASPFARREKLMPLFAVEVERRSCDVIRADMLIEASLGHGHLEANGTRLPIRERELDLKSGDPSQL